MLPLNTANHSLNTIAMREYRISKSGKNVLVSESSYDKFGLPTANRLGIIRVKEGVNPQDILEDADGKAALDKYQFSAVQNKDNGLFEMTLPVVSPVPATEEVA